MKKLLTCFLLVLPAMAAFKSTTQVVPLKYGQESATIVFETTGEGIDDAEPHCDCTKVQVKGNKLTAVVDTRTFDRDVEKTIAAETEDGEEKMTEFHQSRLPLVLGRRSLVRRAAWARARPRPLAADSSR